MGRKGCAWTGEEKEKEGDERVKEEWDPRKEKRGAEIETEINN